MSKKLHFLVLVHKSPYNSIAIRVRYMNTIVHFVDLNPISENVVTDVILFNPLHLHYVM